MTRPCLIQVFVAPRHRFFAVRFFDTAGGCADSAGGEAASAGRAWATTAFFPAESNVTNRAGARVSSTREGIAA